MLQKKSKNFIIYIFLFLLIGTLNNKNLKIDDIGTLDEIQVSGLNEKNNLEIKNDLNFLKIKNIFFLNDEQIKEILNSNNLIEQYSVFKNYPSTLNIKIDRTKIIAQTKKDKNYFSLGTNGRFIKTESMKDNIPFIFGTFENKNFFELKKAIDNSDLNYRDIKNFFSFKSGRWDIETNDGILIRLPKNRLKDSLNLSIKIKEKMKRKITVIDLRQKNQVVING